MLTARLIDRRFIFAYAACFFAAFGFAMATIPAMPLLASGRGASTLEIGLAVALPIMVATLLGRFSLLAKLGNPRLVALVGAAASAMLPLLYPLCTSPLQILVVRAVHGAALAAIPFATITAADALRDWHNGRSIAIPAVLGWTVGPLAGGILADAAGLTAVFAVAACSGVMCVASTGVLVLGGQSWADAPELAPPASRSTSGPAALRLAFGSMETLLPLYALDLGLGARHVGILFALVSTWSALLAPVWSRLVFRAPAGVLVVGLMGASVAVTTVGLAPQFATLVLAMTLLGGATAGVYAAQRPGVAFDGAVASRAPSLHVAERSAHAFGPVVVGFLLPALGAVAVFQLAGILLAGAAVLVAALAPHSALRTERRAPVR